MAQTVGDLEADGLVGRRPDPGDRRRAPVELTDAGRGVLAADRRRREGWLASAIEHELSPGEQALLAQTVELFRRLADG
jgi:DNA-binding MarR family transcriptional regulator